MLPPGGGTAAWTLKFHGVRPLGLCKPIAGPLGESRVDNLAIAASGMRAASLRLDAAASNVARLPVPDAMRLGVAAGSLADGGVDARLVATAADPAAPVGDLIQARSAALAFDANARVLRAGDQALGFLLDVVA